MKKFVIERNLKNVSLMKLIKPISRFFIGDKKPADPITEAISEGIKEAFKEMEYPFGE